MSALSIDAKPKETSFHYGDAYQQRQADKFRRRYEGRSKLRIDLAERLLNEYVLPGLGGKSPAETVVVDVGCSVGNWALEFAKWGYRAYGIDFDPAGIEIARQLAREEGVSAEFVCGDVSDWNEQFPPIDIAVCFDIFEHLHDDELGSFLVSVRKQLAEDGSLIFHTGPTEFRHFFIGGARLRFIPLAPFAVLPAKAFTALVRAYSALVDVLLLLCRGRTHRELIKMKGHCNPTTPERLRDILQRAGYEVTFIEATNVYPGKRPIDRFIQALFRKQPVAANNLYGVARPKRERRQD